MEQIFGHNKVDDEGKSKKVVLTYIYGFCGFRFEHYVGSTGGGTDAQNRNISKVSTQVQCPKCTNFLKTWEGV